MKVNLTYFAPTGKYKYEGSYDTDKQHIHEIWTEIEFLNMEHRLPGIVSGIWNGPISVDVPEHPNNHPRLILPEQCI